MARRNEAAKYLLEGATPQQIATRMGVSLSTVRQYLCTVVGEGELLFADIAFAISERQSIEDTLRGITVEQGPHFNHRLAEEICRTLWRQRQGLDRDLIHLYLIARDPRGDLYKLICETELRIHGLVRRTLERAFGKDWWREGVPESTRKNCQIRREEDPAPFDDPYHYTTFVDLKSIIDKNWAQFCQCLPKSLSINKQETLQKFQRLNDIRNRVMHPVKAMTEYETDYRFVRAFLADIKTWSLSTVAETWPQSAPLSHCARQALD